MRIKPVSFVYLILLSVLFITSCKKDDPIDDVVPPTYGKLNLIFNHKVDGQTMVVDTFMYTNTAGNLYLVNEIQYFISDVCLHKADGSFQVINEDNGIHYIDTDLPETHTWSVSDNIETGDYNYISFTFGINETKNQSNMFVNPPESNMFWPEELGGGYHYMKLNGQYKDTANATRLFNFHLGIGQIYAGGVIIPDSITEFVQNYFNVVLPASALSIEKDATRTIVITMNVNSWFDTPNVWDHNVYGTHIMQNQAAMQAAKENGVDVFTIDTIY